MNNGPLNICRYSCRAGVGQVRGRQVLDVVGQQRRMNILEFKLSRFKNTF